MLHYFPEPRPEELFLSIIARYGEHLRLQRRYKVENQLFGRSNIVIGIEMPRALEAVVDRLPVNCRFSVDDFIDKHTLLRLYLPFISPALRDHAAQAMRGDKVQDMTAILGRNGRMHAPDWLRFCPICFKQDQQTFGEAYWHRSHQVPGVEVCAKHLVFLEVSNASRNILLQRYTLNTARASCPQVKPRTIDISNKNHSSLLDIAIDVDWLLEKNYFLPDPRLIQNRYIDLLIENGFAVSVKKIHYKYLREAIRVRFDDIILQKLDCSVPENGKFQWIKRLIRQADNVLNHPLHHLVLIRSLGFSIESFFNLLHETPTRFGRGPWPCDNSACPEYRRRVINSCETHYNKVNKKLEGFFRCPKCGYVYSGTGILDSTENPFLINRCHDRGDLWNERLRLLWDDENNTLCQIGRALRISVDVLVRQVMQHGLPLRKCDENFALINAAVSRSKARVELAQAKRMAWIELCGKYPEAGFKQLERLQNSPAAWLMANDRSWLLQNRPAIRRRGRKEGDTYVLVDWASRDQEYSSQIKMAASAIKSQHGRPIRVSMLAVCRMISINNARSFASRYTPNKSEDMVFRVRPLSMVHVMKKYATKYLPLTESAFRQVLESPVELARRRLLWAADECRKDSLTFTRHRLMTMAGVRTLIGKDHKRPESIALCALIDELCCGVTESQFI